VRSLAVGLAIFLLQFRAGVDMVTINATVQNRDGDFVAGLKKEDFTVFEDGQRRDIVYFEDETTPGSIAILLDASGSMAYGTLDFARDVIERFVTHDLDARSEWMFARFNTAVVVGQEWTMDRAAIVQPLRETRATGDTSLNDAVALTVPLAQEGHFQKKTIVLVSDGGETRSVLSMNDVGRAIGESDVRLYVVRVIARRRAGDAASRKDVAAINRSAAQIADALSHQYLLGYATAAPKDQRRHRIRVDVRGRGRKVQSREAFSYPEP